MMQIVAEDEHGDEEIDAEHRPQPRRHRAVEHVLIRAPRDPEERDRQPAAKHIVEIPEYVLQCAAVCEDEDLHRAVQFPEEEHDNEEEDGTPRPTAEHAAADARPPYNRRSKGQNEDGKALVRLARRQQGALHDLRVVACIDPVERVREVGRYRADICGDGRVARRREIVGQLRGECEGHA